MSFWGKAESAEGKQQRLAIGAVEFWIVHSTHEWCLAERHVAEDQEPLRMDEEKPGDLEWKRWAIKGADSFVVEPALPPRPVVVRPQNALQILPGEEAQFFVSIPLWLQIKADLPKKPPVLLYEFPSTILSKSWFGSPVSGEPAYSLKTRARRAIEELDVPAHRAICPICIRNAFETPLVFDRLCLRVPLLGIYQGVKHLWTNAATVVYRGEEAKSSLELGNGAPRFDDATALMAPPRQTSGGLVFKAFENLKSMAWG